MKTWKLKGINKTTIMDNYTESILRHRYNKFLTSYIDDSEIIKKGILLRHQNPPEDITENITKFIIQNYEKDLSCKWAKSIGLKGDLYSDKYNPESPIEVKAFTSDGPSSFGPKKKFGVIYFLDMRNWVQDSFKLWKVNVSNDSLEWKQLQMNKKQTHGEQCEEGRRPHISWDKIYLQIPNKCVKIYDGNFEGIFMSIEPTV